MISTPVFRRLRTVAPALLGSGLVLSSCVPPRAAVAPGGVEVYLNHLYVHVDSSTYAEIAASEFLRNEFSHHTETTVQAGDGRSWRGTYLFGAQTYLEFFPPGRDSPVGRSGIAFGVEVSGGIESVRERLSSLPGGSVRTTFQTRVRGADTIPWYHTAAVEYADPAAAVLTTWTMETHPEYLRRWVPDLRPEEDGLTRRQYLARRFAADRYLDEVVGVTLALGPAEAERFANELSALGFRVTRSGPEHGASGPDVEFRIVPATVTARGIVELRLRLLRPKEGQAEYRFGPRSLLQFHSDRTATWAFR